MQAVILAGGLGTRLRGRIQDLPKPMAPIAGRPFLSYLLDRLVQAKVGAITLSVGYKAEVIQSFYGSHYLGVPIRYAIEAEPLGTGGALALAMQGTNDEPFIAMNGDTLLEVDLQALIKWYESETEPLAMVLRKVPDAGRYGAIELLNGRVAKFNEKGTSLPGFINGGIYIIQSNIFKTFNLRGKFSFEIDVLQKHCSELKPRAFLTDAYFIDIGIPEDLDRACVELPKLNQTTIDHS